MSIELSNTNINNTDLNMYHCGMEDCAPGHFFGPAVRDHYLIHYIIKGKGFFKVGEKTYFLKAGDGFLICPNIVTYYEADSIEPWSYRWIGFNGLKAESYLKKANLTLNYPIFNYINDTALADCLNDMLFTDRLKRSSDIRLLSLLYQFLSMLVDNCQENNYTEDMAYKRKAYIQKAIEFIEKNYSRKISIKEISKSINLDRSYFGGLFKESLNKTPQEYLIEFRINKACELMRNNSLSIGDISRSVGYEDQLLFSKIFKKAKKASPKKYRNQHLGV